LYTLLLLGVLAVLDMAAAVLVDTLKLLTICLLALTASLWALVGRGAREPQMQALTALTLFFWEQPHLAAATVALALAWSAWLAALVAVAHLTQ
jgi:hypothetical protein